MRDNDRRFELRRFLRDRRSRVVPEAVGLASIGRRRVRGLRREEVALLAGIGVSWYTALENGEDRKFSEATLAAVAEALRLTESEREYLLSLALGTFHKEQLEPPSPLILAAMNANAFPSYVITAEWNILACNAPFRSVWGVTQAELPFNALERLYIDRTMRAMHAEFFVANVTPLLAMIRSGLASRPQLSGLQRLRDVVLADDELRKIWERFEVADPLLPNTCAILSPIGPFRYEALTLPITEKLLAIVVQVPDASSCGRLATALRQP